MSATVPKIRIRGLRKAFGAKQVLDGVDLDVWPATSMVVIGGSGTGKSVLLKCILGAEAARRADGVLEQVGLSPSVGDLSPSELSGGMQKRVALARAIASEPAIMFFDEPTTGLDPIMGAVIDGLIVDCVKRLGSTAVAITHDMVSTMRIGDRAAMLRHGRIIWEGPAADVMTSGDPVVDQFTHGRREGPIQMELRR